MISMWCSPQPLVLASRSATRLAMLQAAGIPVEVSVPDVDERAVESAVEPQSPPEVAALLARAKAWNVARKMPGRLVVGSDQTLALGSQRFDKPRDRDAARSQLSALVGRTHHLYSAVALVRDGNLLEERDTANLTMRAVSEAFLDRYVQAAGDNVLISVGGYQLERLGIQLFERIEGDHFTILGLPLLRLLELLRREGSLLN
jgi:nucleoside triphosphate pyrophosphatase